jgi:rubrerythrin
LLVRNNRARDRSQDAGSDVLLLDVSEWDLALSHDRIWECRRNGAPRQECLRGKKMRTTEHSTTKPADAATVTRARREGNVLAPFARVSPMADNKRLPIRCCALSCASERDKTMMRAKKELRQKTKTLKHSESWNCPQCGTTHVLRKKDTLKHCHHCLERRSGSVFDYCYEPRGCELGGGCYASVGRPLSLPSEGVLGSYVHEKG